MKSSVGCKKHHLPLEEKVFHDPFLGNWVEWVCPLCEKEKLENLSKNPKNPEARKDLRKEGRSQAKEEIDFGIFWGC